MITGKTLLVAGIITVSALSYTPDQSKDFQKEVISQCSSDNPEYAHECPFVSSVIVTCVNWMADNGVIKEYPESMNDIWGMDKEVYEHYLTCFNHVLNKERAKFAPPSK